MRCGFQIVWIAVAIVLSQAPCQAFASEASSEASGQEASLSESQAVLASLFGRGGKIPSVPRIDGTIALPSFDSSGMQIDESALIAAQRGERTAGNGGKKTNG